MDNPLTLDDLQAQRQRLTTRLAVFLLVGFIFPVFGGGRLIFFNIELISDSGFITVLSLLYPLAAGLTVLVIPGLNIKPILRPSILMGIGFLRILIGLFLAHDFVFFLLNGFFRIRLVFLNNLMFNLMKGDSEIGREVWSAPPIALILILLMGIYTGSRLLFMRDHISGRIIGGISGFLFLVVAILPIGLSRQPIYFGLYNIFNSKNTDLPIPLFLYGFALIIIFTCFLYAAWLAILNGLKRPESGKRALRPAKLVMYSTMAVPISIMFFFLLSPGVGTTFTSLIKLSLLLSGYMGLITVGAMDLSDLLLSRTKIREEVFLAESKGRSSSDFVDDPDELKKAEALLNNDND